MVSVYRACRAGDIEALKRMSFDVNASVYLPGKGSYSSVLAAAVCEDKVECAVWLVRERGAALCIEEDHFDMRWCALDFAESPAMVRALRALGAHATHVKLHHTNKPDLIRAFIDCGVEWDVRSRPHVPTDVQHWITQRKHARQRAMALLGVAKRCQWLRDPLGIVARFVWAMRWNN